MVSWNSLIMLMALWSPWFGSLWMRNPEVGMRCFPTSCLHTGKFPRNLQAFPPLSCYMDGKSGVLWMWWRKYGLVRWQHRLIKTQIGHARDFTWYRGQRLSPARVILSHERVQIHARENLCSYATNPPHFRVRELLLCDILITRAGDGRWPRYQAKSLACPGCGWQVHRMLYPVFSKWKRCWFLWQILWRKICRKLKGSRNTGMMIRLRFVDSNQGVKSCYCYLQVPIPWKLSGLGHTKLSRKWVQ